MEKNQTPVDRQAPDVTIDPELEKYRNVVLFPRQLALAKERLKNVRLPKHPDLK